MERCSKCQKKKTGRKKDLIPYCGGIRSLTLIDFVFLYHGRIRIIARRSISIEEKIEAQKEVVSKAKDRHEAELEKLEKLMRKRGG